MDQPKLNRGEYVVAVSAIILLLVSFLNWLGGNDGRITLGTRRVSSLPNTSFAINAWGSTLTLIAELIGIGILVYLGLKFVGVDLPARIGRLSSNQVLLGLGITAFALVLIKFITGTNGDLNSFGLPNLPPSGTGAFQFAFHKTRGPGIIVGLLATFGLATGAFLSLRAEQADTRT